MQRADELTTIAGRDAFFVFDQPVVRCW